jgi:transglutaminase-like putative cysteine protease
MKFTSEELDFMSCHKAALMPASFIDSDHPEVIRFAKEVTKGKSSDLKIALALFYAVRDTITYDPYQNFNDPNTYRASYALANKRGFCMPKASLLAAVARAMGIPALVGYADVKNHITTPRLREHMTETDLFMWHSYTMLYLNCRWVKATPAFDLKLCEKAGLKPLEFDGKNDSLFHPYDIKGQKHMEYVKERGMWSDVPFDLILPDMQKYYPKLCKEVIKGDFCGEVSPT